MRTNQKIIALLLTIIAVLFFLGCADTSKEILAEDYKKMNNDDLLRYYYRLNDEIDRQEKQTGPQVGIGLGGFGSRVGGGVGVGTGGTAYTAEDLRARRIDIRMELKKRGLNP
jgi:hypothetical protein